MAETGTEPEGTAWSSAPRYSLASDVLATLALVVLALGWFLFPRSLHVPGDAYLGGASPHLLIEQVDASTTDATGRLYRRLRADALRRASPGEKSMLARPRLTVYPANGARWHFEAETGEVSPDGKNIYLPGPVQGRRGALHPIEIESRDLRIMATENYGVSDAPSTIRGAAFEARGTGLKIWLEDGRIEFLSEARGYMRPQ